MKIILTLLSIIYLTSCFSKNPDLTGHEGQLMPSAKILLSDSTSYFDTKNIPSGKPSAIFLFNPVCPYCKAQMKEIIEEKEKLKGISFYLITTWSYASMKKFHSEYKLDMYSNIIIGIDEKHIFKDYFEIPGVPYIAIYGKDKKLKKAFIGRTNAGLIAKVANE